MRLSARTLSDLAEVICGAAGGSGFEWSNFPYRSSTHLTQFFRACDLTYIHRGETRKPWVEEVLSELNQAPAASPQLPAGPLIRVIGELLDEVDYQKRGLNRDAAREDLNRILHRDNLEAFFDAAGRAHLRNTNTSVTSASSNVQARPLTQAEIERRKRLEGFLDTASEDEFIEELLVPLFRHLGFLRVTATGHRDKTLEFGKDLWMKYQLPTGHYIYFAAQVKKDKIDAAGKELNKNISGILAQVRMALDHPIFDPEANRKHLLDHIYIISANVITKQARSLLIEHLDTGARRHIIFMDREELLDLGAITSVPLPDEENAPDPYSDDNLPF